MVYDRALADYEVANLYAYGQGTWAAATVSNGAWSYTIPTGDNGIEGIYQINVRGTDALGNQTHIGWPACLARRDRHQAAGSCVFRHNRQHRQHTQHQV